MPQDTSIPKRSKARLALLATVLIAATTIGVGLSADAANQNLLSSTQQTFEARTATGWSRLGGTSTATSRAYALEGERSLQLRAGIAPTGGSTVAAATTSTGPSGVAVQAGTTYEGSIWSRSGSTSQRAFRCELAWFSSTGSLLGTSVGAQTVQVSGSWQRAVCAATSPSGAATAALRVIVQGAATGERHYIDEAWIVKSTTAAPVAAGFSSRVNVGSSSPLVTNAGLRFEADRGFVGGSSWSGAVADILGTTDDVMYRKHRWGMTGYNVAVPGPGAYNVRLHFAETVFWMPGQRVFDVSVEGVTILDNLDVQARVGSNRALIEQRLVIVSDGTLNLRFSSVVEDPMLSGLEVIGVSAVNPTSSTNTPTTAPPVTAAPTTAPPTTAAPTTAPPTTAPPTTAPPTTAAPSNGSFPSASNTGVRPGITLQPSGSITTSSNGQVIQNLDINGSVFVRHNNVTIRNVRIRSGGQAISILGNTGLVVEDCELNGTGATDGASAIGDHNYTMRRCNVHHFGEGPRSNGNVVLEDNYFHDFLNFVSQGAHQDVVQITSGYNTTIRHNTMLIGIDGANAAIMIGSYQGGDILVENNLLGGGGYTAYCGGSNGYTNVRYLNNRFSTVYYPRSGYHGPFLYCESATLSGNVWHDGPNAGQPAG